MRCENTRLALLRDTEEIIRRQSARMGVAPKDVPSLFEFNIYTNHQVPVIEASLPWTEVQRDMLRKALTVRYDIQESKTIIFDSEQAKVFVRMDREYTDSLDYRLPFRRTHIQFSQPIPFVFEAYECMLLGMVLGQDRLGGNKEIVPLDHHGDDEDITILNTITALTHTEKHGFGPYAMAWQSSLMDEWLGDYSNRDAMKSLAIACIGYINCENIYLHKEGEVPDAVNRKRAKQGKKILEPYYTCRIRGVQYDSNGEPTGEGTHHGFRYDVRGHFRKLTTGKTTWVRPHQRGLQNELYIPKTYVVEKGAKVMA